METYGKMEPSAIIEDLKKRAKAGKVTEASQKPNRTALDDPKADFLVVSPRAPSVVEEFLGRTRIRFYRTIDDALRSLDSKLYERDVAIVPYGSATDRKSTRLNSSHGYISYAVFCLKKKKHDITFRIP